MSYLHEIKALRADTVSMLRSEGRLITLTRHGAFVRTPSGGQRRADSETVLPAQLLWFYGTRSDTEYIRRVEGEQEVNRSTLVGLSTADIQQGDTFSVDGRNFVVRWVHEDRRYETRARCEEIA